MLAAAVVALARIAFRVLVREHRALRFQDARAGVVLGGNQLDVLFLATPLARERLGKLGIETGDIHGRSEHRAFFAGAAEGAENCTPGDRPTYGRGGRPAKVAPFAGRKRSEHPQKRRRRILPL
jgi:hypothetical protein